MVIFVFLKYRVRTYIDAQKWCSCRLHNTDVKKLNAYNWPTISRIELPDESAGYKARLVTQLRGAAGTEDTLRANLLPLLPLVQRVRNIELQVVEILHMYKDFRYSKYVTSHHQRDVYRNRPKIFSFSQIYRYLNGIGLATPLKNK